MAKKENLTPDIFNPEGNNENGDPTDAGQTGGFKAQPGHIPAIFPDPTEGGGVHTPDIHAQSGETPRERQDLQSNISNIQSAPRQPQTPTPMAGAQGVIPFSPMGGPSASSVATPQLRSLFGGGNGLTGGGLGVPLDPISSQKSDPIDDLMKLLQGGGNQGMA